MAEKIGDGEIKIFMKIKEIQDWAEQNKIDTFNLLLAANEMDKLSLRNKLNAKGGIYRFENESECPWVICTCFDEIIEMQVSFVQIGKQDEIIISCKEKNSPTSYDLSVDDFLLGQLRLIANEII